MREMLMHAGFIDIHIEVKEDAAEIIKDWMPGSGAEKFITSAYVTATKPSDSWGFRDNVRSGVAPESSSIVGILDVKVDASEDCRPQPAVAGRQAESVVGC